ncbi:MAG TPA: MerR family transcriptional regulator [Candidatus Binatia bacterium]|nr:MerR family transcriptional regulator [Candidatus Binatia bacterium]
MNGAEPASLRIGAAARAAGVNVQTMHYYERRGLIRRPPRSAAGYRLYSAATVRSVRAIKRAQSLGFTLDEIAELVRIRTGGGSIQRVAALATTKIAVIEEKIQALTSLRDRLRSTLKTCACGGDVRRCDVLEGLAE